MKNSLSIPDQSRQLTLWPVMTPGCKDPMAIRAARRVQVAFLRLLAFIQDHDDLEYSEWLDYVASRTHGDFCHLRSQAGLVDEIRKPVYFTRGALKRAAKKKLKEANRVKEANKDRQHVLRSRYSIRQALRGENPRCAYCNRGVSKGTIDHVIPKSRGGGNAPENLVLACCQCNAAKSDRTPQEWAEDILQALEKTYADRLQELDRVEGFLTECEAVAG